MSWGVSANTTNREELLQKVEELELPEVFATEEHVKQFHVAKKAAVDLVKHIDETIPMEHKNYSVSLNGHTSETSCYTGVSISGYN